MRSHITEGVLDDFPVDPEQGGVVEPADHLLNTSHVFLNCQDFLFKELVLDFAPFEIKPQILVHFGQTSYFVL